MYIEQFFSKEGLLLPDPNKDSDLEKKDSVAPSEVPVVEPFALAEPINAAPSCSIPPSSLTVKTTKAYVVDSEKTI